jgi:hypothetical protein
MTQPIITKEQLLDQASQFVLILLGNLFSERGIVGNDQGGA